VSRFSDFRVQTPVKTQPSLLPPVDWTSIGAKAPTPVNVQYNGPKAPLPKAEVVMITWTDAEWSAMDHVFLHGSVQGESESTTLIHKWLQYSRSAPGGSSEGGQLWGYYQLVDIHGKNGDHRVLLLKSDAHLAHPPWISGLENMVKVVIADAQPKQIYSIGTAGGASVSQRLGDVAITNAGTLQLAISDNKSSGLSGKTFTSNWFPDLSLLPKVESLYFPLSRIATQAGLEAVLASAKRSKQKEAEALAPFSLSDLLNSAIDPANLGAPKAISFQNTPLLTTDTYYIAPADTKYAALEMDDAVLNYAAGQAHTNFISVRNISDTLVPAETPAHKPIPPGAREAWSSAVYDAYGMFTSYNGAIAAWATIAAS